METELNDLLDAFNTYAEIESVAADGTDAFDEGRSSAWRDAASMLAEAMNSCGIPIQPSN